MSTLPDSDKLPVVLLTGFLGSGKTTLLSRLLRHPGMARSAVIINEFGEVGLDHELVEKGAEDDVVELAGGCLCCTRKSDLAATLVGLRDKRARGAVAPFERVLIETTGLADPGPILRTLLADEWVTYSYRLDGVVTTVDAVHGLATLERQPEALRQAALADRLLLTKTDLAALEAVAALVRRLAELNPLAEPRAVVHGDISPAALLGAVPRDTQTLLAQVDAWLGGPAAFTRFSLVPPDPDRHGEHIRAFAFVRDAPLPVAVFRQAFQLLIDSRAPDLLRVKGLVALAGAPGPALIHGVQGDFAPTALLERWPSEDRRTRIVFITRDLSPEWVERTFRAFEG